MLTPETIEITLPYPPSMNAYWSSRVIRLSGRNIASIYVTAEGKAFASKVAMIAKVCGIRPIMGEVEVEMHFYRPRRIGDVDNGIKPLLDALKNIAFADDKCVARVIAERHDDPQNPRAEVRIVQRLETGVRG